MNMSLAIGRTRSNVDLRDGANSKSLVVAGMKADFSVDVLEEAGDWLKVCASNIQGALEGYTPRLAVALPVEEQVVFPPADVAALRTTRPLALAAWLEAGGKPEWLAEAAWTQFDEVSQAALHTGVQAAIQQRQAAWDAWLVELQTNRRQEEATLDEWLAIVSGGRNLWSIRAERILKEPSTSSPTLAWAGVDDILLWSGHVFRNDREPRYKLWYQITVYKLGKVMQGWFRADLLEEYFFPTSETDPMLPENSARIFDLEQPLVRFPNDAEIAQGLAQGETAAQYLDVGDIVGFTRRHTNLCGEFCVAALAGVNVMPLLKTWYEKYKPARRILEKNIGTGLTDLQAILANYGLTGEPFAYSPVVAPASPSRLKELLRSGKRAICGVSMNGCGLVDPQGTICHWVLLEDILRVGTGGWVRLYNPFMNREEVYTYDVFMASMEIFGLGLWVDPNAQQSGVLLPPAQVGAPEIDFAELNPFTGGPLD